MSEWRSDTNWVPDVTHTLTRWWSTRKHTRCGAAACVCENPWCVSFWQQADGSFLLISGQMCGHKQRDAHAASLLLEISNPKRDGSGEETIARQRKFKWIKTSRQTAQCTCRKKTAWRAHHTALKLINDSFPRKQSHAAEILSYVDFLSWTHLDLVTFSIYCPQETCLCISRPPLETDQWERWHEPDSGPGLRLLFIYSRLVELLLRLPAPWLSPSASPGLYPSQAALHWSCAFPPLSGHQMLSGSSDGSRRQIESRSVPRDKSPAWSLAVQSLKPRGCGWMIKCVPFLHFSGAELLNG